MDKLKELVSIVRKQKLKKIEIIGGPGTYNSKMHLLFEGIYTEKFKTEEEAAIHIYDSDADDINFKKLKYRLQKRLINTLFFIANPSKNEHGKAYYNSMKAQTAMNILFVQGGRKAAVEIAKQVLRTALKYEFTELVIDAAKRLRRHYSTFEGDIKKFNHYGDLIKKHLIILEAELLAEGYVLNIGIHFAKSRSSKVDLEQLAIQYEKDLAEKTQGLSSFYLTINRYKLSIHRHMIVHNFEAVLKICEAAVEELEVKPFNHVQSFGFLFRMLMSYIVSKQFEKGEIVAKKCLEIMDPYKGSLNWFISLELYMILSFYSKKYQQALSLFEVAIDFQRRSKKKIQLRENWKIYEAYIYYFIETKRCYLPEDSPLEKKSFRITKFLNEVPIYASDKRGLNIPILIIQVLFLLHHKNYDVVIDKVEALDAYCYRYLRKDETLRSNCFIKMLLQLPKSQFHKKAVIRKTAKYLKILNDTKVDQRNQSMLIEIVPYEYLWEDVLNSLENKHVKKAHRTV